MYMNKYKWVRAPTWESLRFILRTTLSKHAYFADGLARGNQLGPIHESKGGPAINSCKQVGKHFLWMWSLPFSHRSRWPIFPTLFSHRQRRFPCFFREGRGRIWTAVWPFLVTFWGNHWMYIWCQFSCNSHRKWVPVYTHWAVTAVSAALLC